ncbi:TPA: hypothetical protein EYO57_06305 [Candidatus Poribacteria bacterium]|nr:hypothetical protein [Candidatus Poribacteria bacterium]
MTRDESVGERSIYLRRHLEHLPHDPDIGSNIVEFHIEASPSHCSASSIPLPQSAGIQGARTAIEHGNHLPAKDVTLGFHARPGSSEIS